MVITSFVFPWKHSQTLMAVFWDQHDPTTLNRQGNDRGTQYRSGIYYYSDNQKATAEKSKADEAQKLGTTVVTEVTKCLVQSSCSKLILFLTLRMAAGCVSSSLLHCGRLSPAIPLEGTCHEITPFHIMRAQWWTVLQGGQCADKGDGSGIRCYG